MTSKSKTKPRAKATVLPPEQKTGLVPQRLIKEQRDASHYLIDSLVKAATGDGARIEIVERLWAMQKEAEDRQAEREFAIAKVALANDIPPIPKRHKIEFIDKHNQKQEREYADRSDIESVLDPICKKHGFSREYSTHTVDTRAAQVLTVRHVAGHKVEYQSPYMLVDTSGAKNNNQGAGSTAEYGRRYALIGAFNIVGCDLDNDGAGDEGGKAPTTGDKFLAKSRQQSGKAAEDDGLNLTAAERALEAAKALEEKLLAADTIERKGAILMQNIRLLKELEIHGEDNRANELRAIAEGKVTDAPSA